MKRFFCVCVNRENFELLASSPMIMWGQIFGDPEDWNVPFKWGHGEILVQNKHKRKK